MESFLTLIVRRNLRINGAAITPTVKVMQSNKIKPSQPHQDFGSNLTHDDL